MGAPSPTEEIWAWIQAPLRRLADGYHTDPGVDWHDRVRAFLDELGIGEPTQHPVTAALLEYLDQLDDAQRAQFLAQEAESFVYRLAADQAGQQADGQQPAPGEDHAVRELADQAYRWVVEQLTAEDPDFRQQLESDPELAQAIYDEALQRLGTTPAH